MCYSRLLLARLAFISLLLKCVLQPEHQLKINLEGVYIQFSIACPFDDCNLILRCSLDWSSILCCVSTETN